ncbi:hypothetical protein KY362_02825 [Candidatus Woesearchaeota archaeon]|nr:hypothetical protein [Candidatus Woesearchaeota archaeon]
MSYKSCSGGCRGSYSSGSAGGLGGVVNKFYIQVNGDVNVSNHHGDVNHGIVHSIAAERTGDIHVYSQSIDNRVGQIGNNYVLNLDNRKIDFIPPYQGGGEKPRYIAETKGYLLPAPENSSAYNPGSQEYQSMITTGLLKTCRPVTQFINDSAEVQHLVVEIFETLTGERFPSDIEVRVLGEEEMRKEHELHGGKWNRGIMGFAVNRPDSRRVFVRQNHLDALMLTMGHEIGHVLTAQLPSAVDEEAKAFAFELAWVKCIVENNIGGLAGNFDVDFMPANNGLHDKAFGFVQNLVSKGKEAMDVFRQVVVGNLTVNHRAVIC